MQNKSSGVVPEENPVAGSLYPMVCEKEDNQ